MDVAQEWSKELAGLTDEQIKVGMTWCDEWPPDVYSFKRHCLGVNGDNLHNSDAYKIHDKSRLLGSVKATKSASDKQMIKINKILGVK